MRHRVILLLLCLSLLLVPAFVALSQDEPPAAKLDLTGVNANQLPTLILTTNVINRTGQPLLDLTQDNFILGGPLAERAEIVDVENITDDNLAFAAVLVIDTSTSMDGLPLEQAKEAARLFVNALGPNDPIAIVTFDSTERVVQDYTTDKQVLLDTIDNLAYGGQTALYDGTVLGIETASRAPLPRRAVVLLSDGSEYGGISEAAREDGLQMALDRGVPVFAVGLGFGIDRRYLEEIATGSSAAFYESPSPEELPDIYRGLAQTFRSQYVVTVELNDFDLAAEAGQSTDFTVQATVPDGVTNVVSSTLRVPISTPIVTLPEDLFANPLTESTEVRPTISADDAIESIVFTTSEGSTEGESYTIDPLTLAPGTYPLSITVTDATDDATTLTTEFTVASLPSVIEINGLPDGAITEPVVLTLTGKGQTPLQRVVYTINGGERPTMEAESSFPFTLDPIFVPAGEHTLTVTATNEGGSETVLEQPVTIGEVAPRIDDVGPDEGEVIDTQRGFAPTLYTQSGVGVSETTITVDGVDFTNQEIAPALVSPGDKEYVLTVTDDRGLSTSASTTVTIALLPPTVSISAPELISAEPAEASIDVSAQPDVNIPSFTYSFDNGAAETGALDAEGKGTISIPASALGNGRHSLSVTVSAGDNAATTREVEFTIALPTSTPTETPTDVPTETPTPSDTPTPSPTANTTATAEALGTLTQQAVDAQATLTQQAVDVTRTAAAQSTRDAVNTQGAETLVAVDTATSQALATVGLAQTAAAQTTAAARRTEIAESNANAINTATADAQGTVDAVATFTALPGLTQTAQIFMTATQLSNEGGTEIAAQTLTQQADATATRVARVTEVAQAALTATAFIDSVTQTAVQQLTQQADATGQAVAQVSTSSAELTQSIGATQTSESQSATQTSIANVRLTATSLAEIQMTQNAIASATSVQATQIIQDSLTATRIVINATLTQIANVTSTQAAALTATRGALDATMTQIAGATSTQSAGLTATENAVNALSTADAQSTINAQSTRQSATNSSDSTAIANRAQTQAALTVTQNARATLTAQPTLTPTIGPSATEPPPLVEIQSAPSPVQGLLDSLAGSPLVLVCVPLLCLLVIIVLFVLGGRRRRRP